MKRVLFYCQHVLGMGHLMRSAALVQGLAEEFEVCFLNGGELVAGFSFPPGVEVVNLPPIKSDEAFARIEAVDGQELATIQQRRLAEIMATYERWQPDLVVIELYPFGRKKFSFELLPLLARIRLDSLHGRRATKTKVVCSLRDILVRRPEQEAYEKQVCDILNRYFDLLLIHADPDFQRLEESFASVGRITIPIAYTGYVAQSEPVLAEGALPADADEIGLNEQLPLILASIGGGRVGYELLEATIEASQRLNVTWKHQLLLFGGPYLPEEHFLRLEQLALPSSHIFVRRYTTHFLAYIARAALSISMAGYNTCVNVLTTGVPALTLPFTGGNNDEQTIRAEKLAARGVVRVLHPDDLQPERLQARIVEVLHERQNRATLSTNGVLHSTARLRELLEAAEVQPATMNGAPAILQRSTDFAVLENELRPYLESLQAEGREIALFLRDDDIDEDEESLRHLLEIGLSRNVPVTLAVIPARLSLQGTRLVKSYKKLCPDLFELHQHGWQHINHEPPERRKCEFGPSRSFDEQYADIARGRAFLEETFGERFFPAFTPPWNRCTTETMAVLDALDFKVFSKDTDDRPSDGQSASDTGEDEKRVEDNSSGSYRFREISITLDFMAKGGAQMREPQELVQRLIRQMQRRQQIGIMLHHKMMDVEAFAFLDQLLVELGRSPVLRFYTFAKLAQRQETQTALWQPVINPVP